MRRLLIVSAILSIVSSQATAQSVAYQFDITATTVNDVSGITGLNVGDTYSIKVGFGVDPVDGIPQLDNRASYGVRQLTYTFPTGDFSAVLDDGDSRAGISIFANDPVRDAMSLVLPTLSVAGTFDGSTASVVSGSQIIIALQDDQGLWLQDDSIPLSFLDVSEYEFPFVAFNTMTVGADSAGFRGTLTGVSFIPEPSTALLLWLGLVGLATKRRASRGVSTGA